MHVSCKHTTGIICPIYCSKNGKHIIAENGKLFYIIKVTLKCAGRCYFETMLKHTARDLIEL